MHTTMKDGPCVHSSLHRQRTSSTGDVGLRRWGATAATGVAGAAACLTAGMPGGDVSGWDSLAAGGCAGTGGTVAAAGKRPALCVGRVTVANGAGEKPDTGLLATDDAVAVPPDVFVAVSVGNAWGMAAIGWPRCSASRLQSGSTAGLSERSTAA